MINLDNDGNLVDDEDIIHDMETLQSTIKGFEKKLLFFCCAGQENQKHFCQVVLSTGGVNVV